MAASSGLEVGTGEIPVAVFSTSSALSVSRAGAHLGAKPRFKAETGRARHAAKTPSFRKSIPALQILLGTTRNLRFLGEEVKGEEKKRSMLGRGGLSLCFLSSQKPNAPMSIANPRAARKASQQWQDQMRWTEMGKIGH